MPDTCRVISPVTNSPRHKYRWFKSPISEDGPDAANPDLPAIMEILGFIERIWKPSVVACFESYDGEGWDCTYSLSPAGVSN